MKKFIKSIVCIAFVFVICGFLSREVYLFNNLKQASAFNSSASSYIVIESNTGEILAKKNENDKRKNASTTKILTAITVIEHIDDINKVVKVPSKAVGVEGSSIYLKKDEEIRVIDLLYGLMLRSGNDAAEALALTISENDGEFAKLMNATAARAGALNSHFVTPHGLDDIEHYTTAYDLAKITAYALKNETFKSIVSTQMHKVEATENSEAKYFYNKNKMLKLVDGAIGVKTGYTKKAGRCLVSAAEIDGMQVVCVVLNCGPMFEDSTAMINEAFNTYTLYQADFSDLTLNVPNGVEKQIACTVKENYSKLVKKGNEKNFEIKTSLKEISAPVERNNVVGTVEVLYNGETQKTIDIVASVDCKKEVLPPNFIEIIKGLAE